MKKTFTFLISALSVLFLIPSGVFAQCNILDDAIERMELVIVNDEGTANRSALVFNPNASLYYSVNAGRSNYLVDVFNESQEFLTSVIQGFDYRGAWWNPELNTFEGNGFGDSGIFSNVLASGTSFPTGNGTVIFEANQPNDQSVGDLDYSNNEIVYYHNGFIHRYSRVNNQFLGQFAVLDVPEIQNLNGNTIVYTGCAGKEFALYDFVDKKVLFVDRSSGNIAGSSQLPPTAPARSTFGMSYANGYFWLFDGANLTWRGYRVLDIEADTDEQIVFSEIKVFPNPTNDYLHIELNPLSQPQRIQLLNMNGQVLYDFANNNSNSLKVDLSNYTQGMYFLNIYFKESIQTQKVMVSR